MVAQPSKIFSLCLLALLWFVGGQRVLAQDINWMTWEEAEAKCETDPKPYFIDIYTDWCGWCKRMDATTFKDPVIVELMNQHFYAVKFNAEDTADIVVKGHVFKYQADMGRRGAHEFAVQLLSGRMSYPSFALLNSKIEIFQILKGYHQSEDLELILTYFGEGHYTKGDPEGFKASFVPKKR